MWLHVYTRRHIARIIVAQVSQAVAQGPRNLPEHPASISCELEYKGSGGDYIREKLRSWKEGGLSLALYLFLTCVLPIKPVMDHIPFLSSLDGLVAKAAGHPHPGPQPIHEILTNPDRIVNSH
jgi:hypothetical protein